MSVLKCRNPITGKEEIVGAPSLGGGDTGGMTASIIVNGLDENSTVTATKDGKTLKGEFKYRGNVAYIGLPSDYTQLEYIESSRAQIFLTDYYANPKTKVDLDLQIFGDYIVHTEGGAVFGSSTNSETFCVNVSADGSVLCMLEQTWANGGKNYYTENVPAWANRERSILSVASGDSKWGVTRLNCPTRTSTSSTPMTFFGINAGSAKYNFANFLMRSWGCVISEDGNVVRNYVPAKRNSDGAVGFYDTVNNTFGGSQTATPFIAGAEITQSNGCYEITGIVDRGMWTVTATDGEDTATQDVLVDSAADFEIEMNITKLWLYREGDECEDVTGGWIASAGSPGTPITEKRDDSLYVKFTANNVTTSARFTTANAVDLTDYSKIYFDVEMTQTYPYKTPFILLLDGSKEIEVYAPAPSSTVPRTIIEYDVSSLNTAVSPSVKAYTGGNYYAEITLYNCWLK